MNYIPTPKEYEAKVKANRGITVAMLALQAKQELIQLLREGKVPKVEIDAPVFGSIDDIVRLLDDDFHDSGWAVNYKGNEVWLKAIE